MGPGVPQARARGAALTAVSWGHRARGWRSAQNSAHVGGESSSQGLRLSWARGGRVQDSGAPPWRGRPGARLAGVTGPASTAALLPPPRPRRTAAPPSCVFWRPQAAHEPGWCRWRVTHKAVFREVCTEPVILFFLPLFNSSPHFHP